METRTRAHKGAQLIVVDRDLTIVGSKLDKSLIPTFIIVHELDRSNLKAIIYLEEDESSSVLYVKMRPSDNENTLPAVQVYLSC